MQIQRNYIYFFRITLDYFFLTVIFISAFLLSIHHLSGNTTQLISVYLFSLIIWYFASQSFALYDEYRSRDLSFEFIALLKTIFAQVVFAIIILFFLKNTELSRTFIIFYSLGLIIILTIEKYLLRRTLNFLRKSGRNLRSILMIGAGEVGKKFVDAVEDNPHFGYKIVGFLDDKNKTFLNGKYLGKISDLDKILALQRIDNVIVALPNYASEKLEKITLICNKHTTRVKIIPDYFRFVSPKYNVFMFGPFPIISVREDKVNEFHWRLLKRGFDTCFTIILFITIFSWFWPLIALAIKLDSKGSVFFKQKRWGRNNRDFTTYKFRSMKHDSPSFNEDGKFF